MLVELEPTYSDVLGRHAQTANAIRMLEEQLENMRREFEYLEGAKAVLETLRQAAPVPYAPVVKEDMPLPVEEAPAKRSQGRIRTPE